MNLSRRLVGIGDVLTTLYAFPITLLGIIWLYHSSDFTLLIEEWRMMLILFGIIALFSYLNFFVIIEFREDRYGSADGAFNSMAVWTAVLIFGPTAIWLVLILQVLQFVVNLPAITAKQQNGTMLETFLSLW